MTLKKMKDGVYYDRQRGKLMEHYGSKISYHWTPQMEADLKRWFPTTMNKELVELFGISQRTIIRKARKMGLEKNKKWLLQVWRDNSLLGYAEARRRGVLGYRKKVKEEELNIKETICI